MHCDVADPGLVELLMALIGAEAVGMLGCTIEIHIEKAAIGSGAEQRQPIWGIVRDGLNLGGGRAQLTMSLIG